MTKDKEIKERIIRLEKENGELKHQVSVINTQLQKLEDVLAPIIKERAIPYIYRDEFYKSLSQLMANMHEAFDQQEQQIEDLTKRLFSLENDHD